MYTSFRLLIVLLVFPILLFAQSDGVGFQRFLENGKQGLKDDSQNVVIPAEYEELGWSDGSFRVQNKTIGYREGTNWGLVNIQNKKVSEPVYQSLEVKNAGSYVIAQRRDNLTGRLLYGMLDINGSVIISFKYSRLELVNETLIAHYPTGSNVDLVGLIDLKENQLLPFHYRSISALGSLRFAAQTNAGKFHLFNDEGKRVDEVELDSISEFNEGYARIWAGHHMGLISWSGEVVVPVTYRDVRWNANQIETIEYPEWREFSPKDQTIGSYRYDRVSRVDDSVVLVSAQDLSWLINSGGSDVTGDRYQWIGEFVGGQAIARKNNRWGVLTSAGEWILAPVFNRIQRKNEFYYTSDQKGRWRIFDRFGVEKTRGYYDEIGEYMKLYFPVRKGRYWGLIYRSGKTVINNVYDSIGILTYEMLPVKFQGLYGIIDIYGNWVVTPDEHRKTPIDDRLYTEQRGAQTLIRNYEGDIIYFTENRIALRSDHFLEYLVNGKVWKVNFEGVIKSKEVVDVIHSEPVVYSEFEDIFIESEGLTGVKKDGKYGFVDNQNRLRIANRYDSIKNFKEGYAPIKLLGKWGFIDKEEKIRIQPVYDWVGDFSNGVCMVRQGRKYYLIDKDHKKFFTRGFDNMELNEWGRYRVRKGASYGLVSRDGSMRVNYIYDYVEDLGNGLVIIEKLGKFGAVDINGMNIIPRVYDELHFDSERGVFFGKTDSQWVKQRKAR